MTDVVAGVTAASSTAEASSAELPDEGIDHTGRPWKAVTFDTPLKRAGGEVTRVIVRKPIGGDYRGAKMTEVWAMDIIALSTIVPRVTEPTIHKAEFLAMEAEDCAQIGGKIVDFLLSKSQRAEAGLTT